MSDQTYLSKPQQIQYVFSDEKNKTSSLITLPVTIHNKYTFDDSGVKLIEVFAANKDESEIPVGTTFQKVGIMQNGYFIHSDDAKNVTFTNKDGVTKNFTQLNKNETAAVMLTSKNISSQGETLNNLGLLNDNEKRNEFFDQNGMKNKKERVGEGLDDFKSESAKENALLLQKSKIARKEYGNYCYPLEMKNTNQDRLKITVLEFAPQDLEAREENTFSTEQRVKIEDEERIKGSAILPIPNGVTDQNAVKFGNGTLNPLQVAGAQLALNTLLTGIGRGGEILSEQAKAVLGDQSTSAAVATLLTSLSVGTDPNRLLARTQGAVFNNNLSLLFDGPTLRPFNFNFNVSPRDQKESIEVLKIIRMFKQSSAVQRTDNGLYLGTPNIFRLEFLSGGQPHKFLPRIKECALLTFSTNYMPNNTYMTYENSSMVAYNLQFSFQELDPIFNDDYDEIDLDGGEFKDGDVFAGFNRGEPDIDTLTIDSFSNDTADSGGIGF